MIRREAEQGWLVVPQPAHALHAALLVAHWAGTSAFPRPEPWYEVLIAISQHDIGWVEWERAPRISPDGWPRNFTELDLEDHLAIWQRGVRWALVQSPFLAYMVSRHATTLYEHRRDEDTRVAAFLEEQRRVQEHLAARLPHPPAALDEAYRLLRLADWFSLALCMERYRSGPVQLGVGPGGQRLELVPLPNGQLTVTPWPFNTDRVRTHVTAYRLQRRSFSGDAELRRALEGAETVILRWELSRG